MNERGISNTFLSSLLCGTQKPAKVLLTVWIVASWAKRVYCRYRGGRSAAGRTKLPEWPDGVGVEKLDAQI